MISRSVKQQALLNAYWIPINFQGAAILTIAVPAALLHFAKADHTAVLATLVSVAGIIAMGVPPIAGAISDHFRRKGMLRRPFILAGAVINVIGLFWMVKAASLLPFEGALLVAVLGQSISLAAYQPLIPEAVHRSEWGLASGYQGVATLIGTVLGFALAGTVSPQAVFFWAGIIVLAGAFAAALTPEAPFVDEGEHAHIGSWSDFVIAFTSRFCINFGLMLLMTFVLYFFNDVVSVPNPSATTSAFGALSLVGAILTSFWMGQLSDRVSRKLVVATAGVPMAAAIFLFAASPGMHGLVFIALLFGLGYGAFASTGWALAIDSVPQLRDVARDLGIWGLASGLPGIFAPAFGGWLLAHYAVPLAGYRALFFTAACFFVAGSIAVLFVGWGKGRFGICFMAIVVCLIYPYFWTKNRIRTWGRLPWRRGATIVVVNHQYDLDTTATPVMLMLGGPWNRPIFSSGSRRMFEPGFMTHRFNWLLSSFASLDATKLFNAIGIYPIENELRVRALRRMAGTVRRRHGDLPVGEVFHPGVLASIGIEPTEKLSGLDGKRWFMAAEDARVSIKSLREPYLSELLAEIRTNIEPDYLAFERLLKAGNTLFTTPEGHYSKDGRLAQLLNQLPRLLPFAELVWLVGLSYDVFVGSRLSLLLHIAAPADPSDLPTSLKAVRPVTTSQVVGAWLDARGDREFSREELTSAVDATLASLPPGAFVDPELARAPRAMTQRAIEGLVRLGILTRSGSGYRLTTQRRYPKFLQVDDMVAYQARFFEETLDALHALRRPAQAVVSV